ncbi:MAG: MBL fold metallo-hydrolase [Methanobacteriota archaeon]|nr:MAG: MBL fold metallo-hydrolase [Euryarchaeota archaeon]
MRIAWHGHACFEINDGSTVVTDPHDGKSIGLAPPIVEADLVLLSHDHYDHNCARIVKGNPTVVESAVEETIKGAKIRTFKTFHDEAGGEKRGDNRIFSFEMDGVTFCHLGDLGHPLGDELVSSIGPVDVLFVPVGSVFTIDGAAGWETVAKIKPKIAVPMHYRLRGLSLSLRPLEDFLSHARVVVTRVGNEVVFVKDDLPESTEVWVFTF